MSITILFKGGRLPSWHALTRDQQKASEQEHVDLMLGIAHRHRMMRLEGFRLMAPQDVFQRFWLLEFPDFADVQAWIDAEMAPSYGRHGYYEYHLSHQIQPAYCTDWGAGHLTQADCALPTFSLTSRRLGRVACLHFLQ